MKPDLLSSSYRSCLDLAEKNQLTSIGTPYFSFFPSLFIFLFILALFIVYLILNSAFCCISTGVFGYPKLEAAHVALATVKSWIEDRQKAQGSQNLQSIVFNVFTKDDDAIYNELVDKYFAPEASL